MRELQCSVRALVLTALMSAMVVAFFGVAHAQSLFPGNQIEIATNPSFPKPNTEFTASLSAYSYNLDGASVRWYVDGSEVTSARNTLTLPLTMGELGSSMTLRVVFTPQGGGPIPVTRTLIASEVDVIVEADTSVPSFYRGRALPSESSTVRVIAVPHVAGTVRDADLFYTWRIGSQTLYGGTARGRNTAELAMPSVPKVLTVTVENVNGVTLGSKSVRLEPYDTELYFYEDNPLRGLSRRVIGERFNLIGDETVVRAEPYFVSNDIAVGSALYTWRINDVITDNPSGDPRSITLRKTGGSGSARVGFEFVNRNALLQRLKDEFTVFFN